MLTNTLLHLLTFTLLFTLTLSSPSPSPSPSPQSGSDDTSSFPEPSSSPSPSPSPSPSTNSHSPDLSPDSDSPPLDLFSSPSPSPSPSLLPVEVSDETVGIENEEKQASGGMSGGKKVGVAFGLIAAACFVGFGGVLYRKRQQNIRRARYSQSARLEFF